MEEKRQSPVNTGADGEVRPNNKRVRDSISDSEDKNVKQLKVESAKVNPPVKTPKDLIILLSKSRCKRLKEHQIIKENAKALKLLRKMQDYSYLFDLAMLAHQNGYTEEDVETSLIENLTECEVDVSDLGEEFELLKTTVHRINSIFKDVVFT